MVDLTARRQNNLGYFCHQASMDHADRVALFDLSRDPVRTVTYAELEARMNRVAGLLTGRGIVAGDRIAMCIGNRFEFVEVMYGMMRAGIVPVPLNTKLNAEILEYILIDSGCRGAIVEAATNGAILGVVEELSLPVRCAFGAGRSSGLKMVRSARGPVPRNQDSRSAASFGAAAQAKQNRIGRSARKGAIGRWLGRTGAGVGTWALGFRGMLEMIVDAMSTARTGPTRRAAGHRSIRRPAS